MPRRLSSAIPGVRVAGVRCGIKPSGNLDLALIACERPAAIAGMFTQHAFPGAPVVLTRKRVRRGQAQAIVVNSGISNVAMGEQGNRDADEMTRLVGAQLGISKRDVLVASTGVIGMPLPMDKIASGIEEAAQQLAPNAWETAARAIMTTDTRPKVVSGKAAGARLIGIAKGAGMIQPKMATMLCFLATDVAAEPAALNVALRESIGASLNSLTIDGETSTSDMVLLLATGAAGGPALSEVDLAKTEKGRAFVTSLRGLTERLAEDLAFDGEGVTRVAYIRVSGAKNARDADLIARSVANSALFKTALFGGDPNWGRIVQAAGAAGVRLDLSKLDIQVGHVPLMIAGEPTGKRDAAGQQMRRTKVDVDIRVGDGPGEARILTTDLTYDYVKINAEYTT